MDEHVADGGDFCAHLVFRLVADAVRIFHRHLRVNLDVHVHKKLVAHLAHETFFHAMHAGNRRGHGADLFDELAVGRTVHQFVHRREQQPPAVPGDDGGGGHCGPVVRRLVAFAAGQRNADAEKSGGGCDRVAAVMPRIGFHGGTFHRLGFVQHKAEQRFLHGNNGNQDNQSPRRGRDAWFVQNVQGIERNPAGSEQQHDGNGRGGDGFGLAVAVGMVIVRRRFSDDEAAPDDDGTKNIGERFHRVGDERLRMAEDAREKFRHDQRDVRGEAEERGAQTALQAVGRHAKMKHELAPFAKPVAASRRSC